MTILPEDLIKLALAVLAGGLIGLEREFRDKAAGFRTLIFICLGAALFTLLSAKIAGENDPTRIAANIVSGVGFLGAGVILREGGRVTGLTTAATIWLTAAIGMGLGSGQYALAGVVVALSMIVLWLFPAAEGWLDNLREDRTYELVCPLNVEKIAQLEQAFEQSGLHVHDHRSTKRGDEMVLSWRARGSMPAHRRLLEKLFADPDIHECRF